MFILDYTISSIYLRNSYADFIHGCLVHRFKMNQFEILGKDLSTPFVEVSKQVGASDTTVHLEINIKSTLGLITNLLFP